MEANINGIPGPTDFRKQIDCYINSIKYLNQSREVSLVNTNLQRAMGWVGKALQFAGSPTPYPNNEDAGNSTIDPRADHDETNSLLSEWQKIDGTQTARVKDFRNRLQQTIDSVIKFTEGLHPNEQLNFFYRACLLEAFVSLTDAKMWFGWELGRIKDVKEGKTPPEAYPKLPL